MEGLGASRRRLARTEEGETMLFRQAEPRLHTRCLGEKENDAVSLSLAMALAIVHHLIDRPDGRAMLTEHTSKSRGDVERRVASVGSIP